MHAVTCLHFLVAPGQVLEPETLNGLEVLWQRGVTHLDVGNFGHEISLLRDSGVPTPESDAASHFSASGGRGRLRARNIQSSLVPVNDTAQSGPAFVNGLARIDVV